MFTKLFSSITDSTIWREPDHVRIVWITMLAKSDSSGFVWASIPGLSDAARVSLEQCVEAIEKLKSPDQWSRSKESEGRRIEDVDGGWRLLNYDKYRKIRNMEERREYVRKKVAEHRHIVNNVNKSKQCKQMLTHVDVETEVEIDKNKKICMAEEVLNYLNEKTGKKFQAVNGSLKFIESRLREGATVDQCHAVIDLKCLSWLKDSKMKDYLRPQTLFNAEKFAAYVGEIGSQAPKQDLKNEWEIFGKK